MSKVFPSKRRAKTARSSKKTAAAKNGKAKSQPKRKPKVVKTSFTTQIQRLSKNYNGGEPSMLFEYEMLMTISAIKAEKGTLSPDEESMLVACVEAWDAYVYEHMEMIKRGLDNREMMKLSYKQNSMFNPNNLGPVILECEDFRRSDLCDERGNLNDVLVRLAATVFCKNQMQRLLLARGLSG